MDCSQCGATLPEAARTCRQCGATADAAHDGPNTATHGSAVSAGGGVAVAGEGNVVQQGKYNIHADSVQGPVIGDGARVEQHFHGAPPTPAIDLMATETQYRQWVVERYDRLGFSGFEQADLMLTKAPLTDVFVRLSLTVEKVVRAADKEEKQEEKKQEEKKQSEQIIKVQEPVTLVEALKKHMLVVGEPGAGKSTLLRWLAVIFAQRQQREMDRLGPEADADRLPVYVELGRLDDAYLRGDGGEEPKWTQLVPALITKQEGVDSTAEALLATALAAGRCLVLCDGLDEIADHAARGRIARSLVEFARLPAGNRVVIGSRPAGMAETESALRPEFERCQIERFTPAEIQQFFHFWYRLDTTLRPEAQTAQADDLFAELERQPDTMKLATTPLLATIILLIWRNEGRLPKRRVEIYERCCKIMIENWEAHHDVAYVGKLKDLGWERHLRLLEPLAYAIHSHEQRTSATEQDLAPLLARDLIEEGLHREEKAARLEAEQFLKTLGLRSGLLQRLGPDRYGFPHHTFQEYLAARHIAAQGYPDYIDLFMAHLHEGWWWEVHLLTLGHLGSDQEGAEKASRLMLEILNYNPPPWRILGSSRRTFARLIRPDRWFSTFTVVGEALVVLGIRLISPGKWLSTLQWQRRLAWLLQRETMLAASGCVEMTLASVQTSPTVKDALVRVLTSSNPYVLWQAATGLSQLGQSVPTSEKVLVRALVNNDWYVRQEAAASLGQLAQSSCVVLDTLARALWDENPGVRLAAAVSLGQLNPTSSATVHALAYCQNDRDSDVRKAAVASLERLSRTSPEVVDALARVLTDDYDPIVRILTARRLGQLGQTSSVVVDALVQALNNSDPQIRIAAATSLGQLDQDSSKIAHALVRALTDSVAEVQEAVATSLGQLNQVPSEAVDVLAGIIAEGKLESWDAFMAGITSLCQMAQTSSVAADALVRILTDGPYTFNIVDALGRSDQASPAVVDALAHALLVNSDTDFRKAAITSLTQLGKASPTVVNALAHVLAGVNYYVRRQARISLSLLGKVSPLAIDALIRASNNSNSEAVIGLGELGQASPAVTEALIRALSDRDLDVRKAAAYSLGELGQTSPAVVDALVRALDDSDKTVQREVVHSLGKLGQNSPVAVDVLAHALSDVRPFVRFLAAINLGKAGQAIPTAVHALTHALAGRNGDIWWAAAASLGQLGQTSPAAADALIRALADNDWNGLEEATTSLERLNRASFAMVGALTYALSTRNDVVQQAAAISLGLLGQASPTAVDALVRALSDGDRNGRLAAAISLMQLGQTSPEVVNALICVLPDRDPDINRAVIVSLGLLGQTVSPSTADALISALFSIDVQSIDVQSHQLAAASLDRLSQASPVVVDALIRVLTDGSWSDQQKAAISLGRLGQASPMVINALVHTLAHGMTNVQHAAAVSLAQLAQTSPIAADALARARVNSNMLVQRAAAFGLERLGQASPAMIDVLIHALADGNPEVRRAAAAGLGELGQDSPAAVGALVSALTDCDKSVRSLTATSLGKLGQASPTVVDALILALADNDRYVRHSATASLAKLRGLNESDLTKSLLALLRLMHTTAIGDEHKTVFESIQALLAGRPIPGQDWQKLGERTARRQKHLMIARWLMIVAAVMVLPALLLLSQERLGADSRPVGYVMAFAMVLGALAAIAQILAYVDQRRAGRGGVSGQ